MSLDEDLKRFAKELRDVPFTIWGITPDERDIKDGEFPINERLAKVKGFEAALSAAQGCLAGDPTLMGAFIVPDIRLDQQRYFSRLKVARATGPGSSMPNLDPNEGDGPARGTLIL